MERSYQGGVSYQEPSDNFQKMSQTIAGNIDKISQNVSSMKKMVNQLQTPQDSHELRNQLRQIQHYTQKLVKDTSAQLFELMKVQSDLPASKMTKERLSEEYLATLNAFQNAQKQVAQKTKEDVRKVKAASFKIGDPFNMSGGNQENLLELGETETREQQQATMQSERELQDLEQREQDIRQLEDDIKDVNQIFKDLGQLVHTQGEMVDSIESHVTSAAENVESGTHELSAAVNYKNSLRRKKVYIAIAIIIILSIIIIVVAKH